MRLASLRLAGFKSFVEPTEITFPSELVGIVGPNGCGKSNTLDALRWVMGESSAKHLRGQSLDDVIFAGSGQRKPVSQASVELVFEHHDDDSGALQGSWARFRDLSIRRVLTRDGQSKYFLNGTRCRRKDIADLFLGTGLGRGHGATSATRSYAIIEQGQINRLLDARPEELRATLEEAAGISRYKERRRETEVSIQHTRDNLSRLSDLRAELTRQLEKLERQAKATERFRLWQSEAAQLELALNALQLRQLQDEHSREREQHAHEEAALQRAQQARQQAQAQLESAHEHDAALQSALHQHQTQAYTLAAEVAQLEQARRHAQAQAEQIEHELQLLEHEAAEHRQRDSAACAELAQLALDLMAAEKALQSLREQGVQCHADLLNAEQRARHAHLAFEGLQHQGQEPAQQLRLERSQLSQSEQQQRSLSERLQRLRIPQLEGEVNTLAGESEHARSAHAALSHRIDVLDLAQEQHSAALVSTRQGVGDAEAKLHKLQNEISGLLAEQRALKALEQAQNNDAAPALRAWLKQHGLDGARAAEHISAASEWLDILDIVLVDALNATPVETLDAWRERTDDKDTYGLWLVEKSSEPLPSGGGGAGAQTVATVSELSPLIVQGDYAHALLNGLRPCDTLESALARRHELRAGECWLTPHGDRVSRHLWQRPPAQQHNHGILKRRQRLEQLAHEMAELHPELETADRHLQATRQTLHVLEAEQGARQREHRDALRQQQALALRVEQLRLRQEQAQSRLRAQRREHEELHDEQQRHAQRCAECREQINALEQRLRSHEVELDAARVTRAQSEQELVRQRQRVREAERIEHAAQSRVQSLQREHEVRSQNQQQWAEQAARLEIRRSALLTRQQAAIAPQAGLIEQLARARAAQAQADELLQHARRASAEHMEVTRRRQQQVMQAEQVLEQARHALERRSLSLQALELRAEAPASKLAAFAAQEVQASLTAVQGLDVEAVHARLGDIHARIVRLGAVNLAALDEFAEAHRQQSVLETQYADLNEALSTLEAAMRTLDQETRSRFRETFEAVNAKLGETFQQLFGGGEARLELQGDVEPRTQDESTSSSQDRWLERGVLLLARPPGKKISHIHLLSGGEKSLTAIALVFAIFQLNPAPFCLLDEVDAPLDEANVGRFCAMVQRMSARVQFIFITHNKTTMELARHLVGVTMREAGVSRIVEVDLDAAVKMLGE